jgi:poly-gamma-glutamate synthesis protein (capsule biosynthesis protein)
MLRNAHFLILVFILIASAAGLIQFWREFFALYEKALVSKTRAELLMRQLEEVELAANPASGKPISLLFAGDIMLSRGVANQIKKHDDYKYPFLKIASATAAADLTFGNLEGPISDKGQNMGSQYSFRDDPKTIEGLKFAGFDVLSVANNHIFDWGQEALLDTLVITRDNGIETVGAGENYEKANAPVIKNISGTKIAFLAYTNLYPKSLEAETNRPGISSFDVEKVKEEIAEIKNSSADIIVVSFHWGDEYQTKAGNSQKNIARSLIDAGADLIIGHHPHVVQEVENYRGKWIVYSLGNFIFDQYFSEETKTGLILKVKIKNKKITDVEQIKIKISGTFQPEIIR